MPFQIHALAAAQFAPLFDMSDAALRDRQALRVIADTKPGYPCRVSLEDAEIGEELILTQYRHLDLPSPYAASHAIYIRKSAATCRPAPDTIPPMLASRLLSLRAFDENGFMQAADCLDGTDLRAGLETLLRADNTAFVDIHFAKPGCFAARVTRN